MPGVLRVSVLEVVDLPEVLRGVDDGATVKGVTAKVTLGPTLFKTQPGVETSPDGARIETWNSNFVFPVNNLRDKLEVSICDGDDCSVTQTAIDTPSIIQKGLRDEFVSLNRGGRVRLKLSFELSDDERKKIETMRVAAVKKKQENVKKTVIFQPLENELKKSPIVTPVVDVPTTYDTKNSKVNLNLFNPKSADSNGRKFSTDSTGRKFSTDKPPKPIFNYAKAIGVRPEMGTPIGRMSIDEEVMAKSIDDVNRRRQLDGVDKATGNTESVDSRPRRNSAPAYLINETKSSNIIGAPDEEVMATSTGDANPRRDDAGTESVDSKPESNSAPSEKPTCLMNGSVPPVSSDDSLVSPARECAQDLSSPVRECVQDLRSPVRGCAALMAEDLRTPVRECVQDLRSPVRGCAAPMAKDMSSAIEVRERTRRDSDEISVSSEDSSSDMELADAGLEAAGPLAKTSVGGRSGKISRSASSTLKTVKARVKRTFSKRSKSSPASMNSAATAVVRNQPPLSMDWLRKVIPLKGCFSIPVVKS